MTAAGRAARLAAPPRSPTRRPWAAAAGAAFFESGVRERERERERERKEMGKFWGRKREFSGICRSCRQRVPRIGTGPTWAYMAAIVGLVGLSNLGPNLVHAILVLVSFVFFIFREGFFLRPLHPIEFELKPYNTT